MRVIKRDLRESNIDIKEIRKALKQACEGIDIDYLEIESHIDTIYRDRITTSEIQKSLIEITSRLTSVEKPEYRLVAARLLIMDYTKEALKRRKFGSHYENYYDFILEAVDKGLYSSKILDLYSKDEFIEAGNNIKPSYDYEFDYAGANLLANRYLITDGNAPFELPQEMFMSISLYLASTEKGNRVDIAKNIYNAVAGRKISLATPILINLRKDNGNLSSCFISAMDDSLDSIFYNINTVAQISKNGGGVGINISRVRATGSEIKGVPNASGGVIPWIKILNDTAVAVNQLGKRAGAVTVALDIWHLDLLDFLELQTETGDQRKKAYDIFPQLVVPDLFMNRVKSRGSWTLFDPHEVKKEIGKDLAVLWGEEFENTYKLLESSDFIKKRKVVSAIDIFKQIMKSQIETGMPYLFFKDSVNRANPNSHDGFIGSGNLCQESFSNFRPSEILDEVIHGDEVTAKSRDGLVHTCNLLSLNLANIEDSEDLERNTKLGIRILDNALELTNSPIAESILHNNRYRTIGLGAMGLADYLARESIKYDESESFVDKLFEQIALYAVEESAELSKDRGAYPAFRDSKWSNGIFFNKDKSWFINNSDLRDRWSKVIDLVKKSGIRNGQLLAIAPNTSSSLLQGCSPGVLPVYSKFHIDKNANGAIPICPPFIKKSFWFYKESKNIDQKDIITVISSIQKWIDQGISMEILYNLNNNITATDIYDTLFKAWESGCKTVYYTRTIQRNSSVISEIESCVSCAN
ncbi:ribonucleoside-diphosphate reductase subunit alpha [Thiospirochaeta perfilievii]|uniref:Ribonucleoside-diphosphate reductase n=1 Tax=Thiospirochaeta perfilievii TaxID=252967 RepID=A0A5C1QJ32_9SPIO|nr:ribonucleoside-diphosphate reductase subunit alpha [Thiospirochaeta perfilievii]QEN06182.1 ribonucleoside-diphosphate reductase subunit alpha [Thiospirochaeta perfilievii]